MDKPSLGKILRDIQHAAAVGEQREQLQAIDAAFIADLKTEREKQFEQTLTPADLEMLKGMRISL